jgi:PKD repeat protein
MKTNIKLSLISLFLLTLIACERIKETSFVDLQARFQPNKTVVRINEEIVFQQQSSTEAIKEYLWEFGDNNTSTEPEPKYAFKEMGTYTVKLTVKKGNGTSQTTTRKIIVLPPTTTATGTNTAQFGEKDGSGLPSFTDEVGIKTLFVKTGTFDRYFMLGRKGVNGLYIIQTDANRNVLWSKNINNITGAKIVPTDIAYDSLPTRQSLVVVGYIEYNEDDKDSFIISLDPKNGDKIWEYQNKSTNSDTYNSLDIVENQYLVSGNSIAKTTAGTLTRVRLDVFAIDILNNNTHEGVLAYSKTINAPNTQISDARYLRLSNEGVLAGYDIGVERPMMLRYTDPDVNPSKFYATGNSNGRALGVTRMLNGRYVVVGELQQESRKDSTSAFIAVLNQDGVFLGMDILNIYKESFQDLVQVGDEVLVVGTHYNPLSQKDILLARYSIDSNGKPKRQAMRLIGGQLNEEATHLIRDTPNTIAILGTSQTLGLGFADMWFMQLNPSTLQ